jgi:hypothetical protein
MRPVWVPDERVSPGTRCNSWRLLIHERSQGVGHRAINPVSIAKQLGLGHVFKCGLEKDFLEFNSGAKAVIGFANELLSDPSLLEIRLR